MVHPIVHDYVIGARLNCAWSSKLWLRMNLKPEKARERKEQINYSRSMICLWSLKNKKTKKNPKKKPDFPTETNVEGVSSTTISVL